MANHDSNDDHDDPIRAWAQREAAAAPPMSAADARLVAGIVRRTAEGGD